MIIRSNGERVLEVRVQRLKVTDLQGREPVLSLAVDTGPGLIELEDPLLQGRLALLHQGLQGGAVLHQHVQLLLLLLTLCQYALRTQT